MFDDDVDPKTKKPKVKDLSAMSVEELKAYKADLLAEAQRVEGVIQTKSNYFGEANKFFNI